LSLNLKCVITVTVPEINIGLFSSAEGMKEESSCEGHPRISHGQKNNRSGKALSGFV